MLQAKLKTNGLWRKDDGKGRGATYNVSGSVADLEAFKKAQGAFYKEDENGIPIFVRREFSLINGRRVRNSLKPQLALGIRREGDGVFVDDSKDYLNFEAKVETQMVTEVAKLQALQFLGINIGDSAATTTAATKQTEEKQLSPEEILAQLEKDVAGGTGIGDNQPGTEKPIEGQEVPPLTVKDGAPAGGVGDLK